MPVFKTGIGYLQCFLGFYGYFILDGNCIGSTYYGFKYVISTLRESFSASHNGWKAMIYNGEEFYESKRYDINPIIDRVGGGDSFSGGIIHGLLTKPNQGAALEFAVAASALKHTINGDFNLVSVEEVEALAGGDASGRVQR